MEKFHRKYVNGTRNFRWMEVVIPAECMNEDAIRLGGGMAVLVYFAFRWDQGSRILVV